MYCKFLISKQSEKSYKKFWYFFFFNSKTKTSDSCSRIDLFFFNGEKQACFCSKMFKSVITRSASCPGYFSSTLLLCHLLNHADTYMENIYIVSPSFCLSVTLFVSICISKWQTSNVSNFEHSCCFFQPLFMYMLISMMTATDVCFHLFSVVFFIPPIPNPPSQKERSKGVHVFYYSKRQTLQ